MNASIDLPGLGLIEAVYIDLRKSEDLPSNVKNAAENSPLDEWQDSIRDLKSHITTLSGHSLNTSGNGKSPLLLRISVLDPSVAPVWEDAQPVTLNVLATVDEPEILSKGERGSLRQPAVCDAHFDVITRDHIWSRYLGNNKGGEASREEVSKRSYDLHKTSRLRSYIESSF